MANTYILFSNGAFISSDELYHHGIKGQKWGVRRYQNLDGSLTAKGRERYYNTKTGMSVFAGMLAKNLSFPAGYDQDTFVEVCTKRNESGGYDYESPLAPSFRKDRWNQDYIDDPDSVYDKCSSKINKTNGKESGTSNNCTKVASTMILAKKGYDYDAGRSMGGLTGAFDYWFDNAEKTVCDNLSDAIEQKFSKTANGTYGTVDLRNKNGGGHVFNWERNSKGEFRIAEGQESDGFVLSASSPSDCFDRYLAAYPWFSRDSTVRVYDMTDATPNFEHMAEDSVVRITDDSRYGDHILDRNTKKLWKDL